MDQELEKLVETYLKLSLPKSGLAKFPLSVREKTTAGLREFFLKWYAGKPDELKKAIEDFKQMSPEEKEQLEELEKAGNDSLNEIIDLYFDGLWKVIRDKPGKSSHQINSERFLN